MALRLPPGPTAPSLVQALRYTQGFPALTAQQHARHGPSWTLRLPGMPDSVVTTDRELIRTLLTGDAKRRRHANDVFERALGSGSVMLLEPVPHLERRRLLLPPFHGERIGVYARLMQTLTDAELDTWSGEVAVHDRARSLTLGVIQTAVLGSRDKVFATRLRRLLDIFNSAVANLGLFAPALSTRARWNVLAAPFWRERDRFDALMAEQIERVRADPALEGRDDVLSMLLLARDDRGRPLSDQHLNDELKTLISAGHETTATAIAWGVELLAHRPDAAAALRRGDRAYVSAAAQEVLRLRTITPVSMGRTLLEPAATGDWELPAGTVVLADAYSLHADPSLHGDPGTFRPGRFYGEGPPPYAYLPWGGGAHRCLGRALATQELEIALKTIVDRFDLEPVGPPETPVRRGPTLVPAKGARVRVTPRG